VSGQALDGFDIVIRHNQQRYTFHSSSEKVQIEGGSFIRYENQYINPASSEV
jgi:hypothetical protein